MEMKSAREVLQEIESTRKEIGSVNIIIDGAQTHFILESMVGALKIIVELFNISESTPNNNWEETGFGTQEDSFKTAKELGATAISTIKIFTEALPDNLRNFHGDFTSESLNYISKFFEDN